MYITNKMGFISEDLMHPHVKLFNEIAQNGRFECHSVSAKNGKGVLLHFQMLFEKMLE